jgi:Flp pilus assembly secretin CpaC
VDTVVRVKDGETLLLGGFPRSNQALQATGLPVNFRKSSSIEDIDSLLFVTPRIVRFLEP